MNNSLKKEIQDVHKGIIIFNLVALVLIFILSNSVKEMVTGLLFGSIISVLNFRLLAISLQKAVNYSVGKAQAYTSAQYTVRMFIITVVIFVSVKSPHISIIGTTIGLLSTKFAILGKTLVIDKLKRKEA
ncbi:MAG: ATP synthase subunit I [Paraclostridium sp.]